MADGNTLVEVKNLFSNTQAEVQQLADRLAELETNANRPGAPFAKARDLRDGAKAQMVDFLRTGQGLEAKQLQGNVGAQGGFAVPEQIDRMVLDQLVNISPVRSVAMKSSRGRLALRPALCGDSSPYRTRAVLRMGVIAHPSAVWR